MATGGIFQLITNDGKQDRMLMASALLKSRLDQARAARAGQADTTPTLYDIERTHILFTNAHFKPFAAIGYEYNKVTNSAGSATINENSTSEITFSIPQFGDFFSDMVVHVVMSQPTLKTTDASGDAVPASEQNLMRWCDFPGERLLKHVKFNVNGNPLDEYTRDAVNFHREFQVQPNKEVGWNRCMGQQEKEDGWLDQPNWAASNVASSAVGHRTCMQTTSGLQTPTGQKTEQVELFIPLLFWCNKDPRLAVPSVAIPYGQRFINITLAPSNELVGEVPRGANAGDWSDLAKGGALGTVKLDTIELYINNIFVNPEVHNIFIKRIGFTLIRVHRQQNTSDDAGGSKSVHMNMMKWPIEALFIGMRVKEYASSGDISLNKKNLDKWHKFSMVENVSRTMQGWNSQKSSTVESATLGAALGSAAVNVAAAAGDAATLTGTALTASAGDILSFTQGGVDYTVTVVSVSSDSDVLTVTGDDLTALNGVDIVAATAASVTSMSSEPMSMTVQKCSSTLSSVSVEAHGIPIYSSFPSGFYNAYIPLTYGGHNIRAPKDCGALMVTFCLYPGTYQPSGHINVSRAREFYLKYTTTSAISSSSNGELVIVASAINFLLISDGSAVLRYST